MPGERLDPAKMYQYFSVFGHLSREEALPHLKELSQAVADPVNLLIALGCCGSFTVGFFWHPVPGPGDTVQWEPHSHINQKAIDPFLLSMETHYELFSKLVHAVLKFEVPDYLPTLEYPGMVRTLAQGMQVCGELVRAYDLYELDSLG